MSNNKTLSLPNKAGNPTGSPTTPGIVMPLPTPAAAQAATPEQVAAFLKANGLMVVAAPADGATPVLAITPDATIHNPVESHRPDLSRLPPPGERSSSPLQLPARTWGQPKFLTGR